MLSAKQAVAVGSMLEPSEAPVSIGKLEYIVCTLGLGVLLFDDEDAASLSFSLLHAFLTCFFLFFFFFFDDVGEGELLLLSPRSASNEANTSSACFACFCWFSIRLTSSTNMRCL